MKSIAFSLQKGGVGKTTLSAHIAWAAAEAGIETVLIDADPQGNTTSWLAKSPPRHELADVLNGSVKLPEALMPIRDNLRLLGTFAIGGDLPKYDDARTMLDQPHLFADLCDNLALLHFDLAVFDLSPGMGTLEQMVLKSVDEVITPLTPEFFSLDGIQIFKEALEDLNRKQRTNVLHRRIVANMINRSFRRHRSICREFEKLDYELFSVPQDSRMAEALLAHETVFEYAPDSRAVPELRRLAAAVAGA